jgi:hypothetical protein
MPGYSHYFQNNRCNWDDRAPAHAASPDYHLNDFVRDPAYLSHVVRYDRHRLGDIRGCRTAHLQCHIGTDTISLERLGASVTGLDFSAASIARARALAAAANSGVTFVEANVYDAADVLGRGQFDLGALADPLPAGQLLIAQPYFERPEPVTWDDGSTYVATSAVIEHTTTHEWNHGLGEIVTALLDSGLQLTDLQEHQSAPWDAIPGQMQLLDDGEWQLREQPWRLPLTFTIQAVKPG